MLVRLHRSCWLLLLFVEHIISLVTKPHQLECLLFLTYKLQTIDDFVSRCRISESHEHSSVSPVSSLLDPSQIWVQSFVICRRSISENTKPATHISTFALKQAAGQKTARKPRSARLATTLQGTQTASRTSSYNSRGLNSRTYLKEIYWEAHKIEILEQRFTTKAKIQ